MRKFMKESWAIIGYIVGLIGTFVTIFTVSGSVSIETRWLIVIGIVVLSSMVLAILAIIKLNRIIKNGTRHRITTYEFDKDIGKDVYYTDYSDSLRIGTIVTIYYARPRSKKMGYGVVKNVVNEEYVEVNVFFIESAFSDIFEQSKTNDKKVLNDMYILPNTYIDKLHTIVNIIDGGVETNGKG